MQALDKICDILGLQRKNLEREIAALDSKIGLIDGQLREIQTEKARMTQAVFSGEISENVVQDTMALEAWKGKLGHTVLTLEKMKRDLFAARAPKVEQLTVAIVREDILHQKRLAQIKERDDLYAETQTSERLETWVNTHIL